MRDIRITTWNVNGIRNPFGYQPWRDRRTFEGMFDVLEADIVVMQELKIQRKDLSDDMVLVPGWDCYFSLPKHKKGYSGVAVYVRQAVCSPIRAEEGLLGVLCPPGSSTPYRDLPEERSIGGYPTDEQLAPFGIDFAALDSEGRCVALEFPAFVLLGVYSPANSSGNRDDFRFGWTNALDMRIRNLDKLGKRVILMGDLNVSSSPLDSASAEEDMKKFSMAYEEYVSTPNRWIFNQLLEGADVVGERDPGREKPVLWDTCRGFHNGRKRMYTHWEQKINARPANYGSRIDYVLCSISMKSWVSDANIQEGLMGSDHCPVYASFKDTIDVDGKTVKIVDVLNPQGMFIDSKRACEWSMKALPALSGRLLPEFDRRRNIRDMFTRKPTLSKSVSSQPIDETNAQTSAGKETTSLISTGPKNESLTNGTTFASPTKPMNSINQSPPTIRPKRSATEEDVRKTTKRMKPEGKATAPANAGTKGQQSLKGFFKPKTPTLSQAATSDVSSFISVNSEKDDVEQSSAGNVPTGAFSPPTQQSQATTTSEEREVARSFEVPPQATPEDQSPAKSINGSPSAKSASPLVDPIVSKESWMKLFTKPVPPRCEGHDEPCVVYKTKKSGMNCGREFWLCPSFCTVCYSIVSLKVMHLLSPLS